MVIREVIGGMATYCIPAKYIVDNIEVVCEKIDANFSIDKRNDLEVLVIPPTINTIYDNFWACNKLVRFDVLKGNNSFNSDCNGVLYSYDKKTLIRVPPAYSGKYILPHETCAIHSHAFTSCMNISEIILHQKLQVIGVNAFYDCKTQVPITIPNTLSRFEGCTNFSTENKHLHFITSFLYKQKEYTYEEISQLFQ